MTKTILRTTILAQAFVALTLVGCDFNITGFSFTGVTAKKSNEGLILEGVTQVEIFNEFGDVNVSEASSESKWTWEGTVWADTQNLADTHLGELEMDVQTDGTEQTWTVILPESQSNLNGIRSDLHLALPAGVAVTLHNRHGNVSTSNTDSDLDLTNAHGNLKASQFLNGVFDVSHGNAEIESGQSAVVQSAHGGATVRQIAGNIDVECRHGGLSVEDVSGDAKISSHHGGVTAIDLRGNSTIEARHGGATITTYGKETSIDSAHGGVRLTSLADSFDKIDIVNRHGAIKLTLPASTKAVINMNVMHGNASSEIAAVDSSRQVNLDNHHGNITVLKSTVMQAEAVAVEAEAAE